MAKITTRAQYLARYRARGAQMAPKIRASDIAPGDALAHLWHLYPPTHGAPLTIVGPFFVSHRIGHGSRPDHSTRAVSSATLSAAFKRARSKSNRIIHEPIETWKAI
jgi:hypothetical protein